MKKTAAIFTAILLIMLPGCESNPLYFRLSSNYFPVSPAGATWEYSIDGGGSKIVTVVDQSVIGERPCWRLQSGADYAYWINEDGRLEKYENHTVLFNGFEVPIYQAWITMFQWPLADGMTLRDSVSAQAVSQGVTLSHTWIRNQTVTGPEVSPNGVWSDCYRIHQEEMVINWIQTAGFTPETTLCARNIWLAPDVGMVIMQSADSLITLSSFTGGEE
ncbi:MAG: hypothetical protein K8S62_12220 [Candidatus Sabulitectum sp.]|nr:hypothetical protein [Candidatus Sabulitectum sp.]